MDSVERRARAKGKAWEAIRPVDFRVAVVPTAERAVRRLQVLPALSTVRPIFRSSWGFRRRGRKSGEAAAGGGALEIISAGELIIESGVNVSMDGGSVLVNPNQGAYFSGGAGAGGSIRLVARSIVNKGNLSAKGGHASGIDPREPGVRFLSNSGGAGGGGRVAFLYDDALEQGSVVVDGGTSNGDAKAGRSGTLFIGARSPSPLVDLNLTTGTVVFETAGAWTHSSGIKGKGSVTRSIFSTNGRSFGYGVCRFRFNHFSLGPDVSVVVRGSNSLLFDVEGNASVSTHISLDGKSGLQGVYSGLPGSGGWASGRGLRDTENNGNLHPALNGQGPGEDVVTRRRSPMAVAVMVVKEAEALIWGLPEWYTGMKKSPLSAGVRAVGTPLLAQGNRAAAAAP